ncbi:MAG: hypothetical protein H7Y12_10675 [Sphingobacteriaceae bacterium]|nr:hypothetical protein [Cytophagaceae bacterium]
MKTTLALLTLLALFLSCKKSGESAQPIEPDPIAAQALLTEAKNFTVLKQEVTFADGTTNSTNPGLVACLDDNQLLFKKDGTYEKNDGPLICVPGSPFILDQGQWELTENNRKLGFKPRNTSAFVRYDVTELTAVRLSYELKDTFGSVYRFSYRRN